MEKDGGKKRFWGFLTEKYLLLSLVSAVLGAAAAGGMGAGAYALWDLLPFAILAGATLWVNMRLKKRGIYHGGRNDCRKSADPRVMGTVGDISGIGCTAAAFMGIGVLFSEMYLVNGGIFGEESFALPLLSAAAKALQLTACIGLITSREWSEAALYDCIARSLKIAGGECYKKMGRIGSYPGIMDKAGGVLAARLSAGAGFAAAELMCAVSGGGLPYGTVWASILAAVTLVVTECACVTPDKSRTEDKHKLMSKSRKNFVWLNVLLFTATAFFFLFSFPIRSVFTEYVAVHDFDYHVEMTGEVEAISVPYDNDDNSSLFTGFFLVSGGFALICSAAACAVGRDMVSGVMKGEPPGAVIPGIAVIGAVSFVHGKIYPPSALDGLTVTVSISVVCFITAVNLIALLMKKR
ncbi:MAG: hypothetical protein NC078_07630 [Ruminococcus sp.]|nr:hypothetical protein [Ruminococcus sp.]